MTPSCRPLSVINHRFILCCVVYLAFGSSAHAQHACELMPTRDDNSVFVGWSRGDSPALVVQVPDQAGPIEVTFDLQLPSDNQSWTVWLESDEPGTESLIPTPPDTNRAIAGRPGLLTAVARHYNLDGEVVFAHGSPTIPVTLSAGALTRRTVVPVRTQIEVDGRVMDALDDSGGIAFPVERGHKPLADEVWVDHE
jgi:hypothetical protein